MESYEEKYKQALENAKQGKPIEEIFPELAENEDEKIMNAIIYAICQSTHTDGTLIDGVTRDGAIAWLEKHGEQKTVKYDFLKDFGFAENGYDPMNVLMAIKRKWPMVWKKMLFQEQKPVIETTNCVCKLVPNEEFDKMSNFQKCLVKMFNYADYFGTVAAIKQFSCLAESIAKKEQKPVKETNFKKETRFKFGDIIRYNGTNYQIVGIDDIGYNVCPLTCDDDDDDDENATHISFNAPITIVEYNTVKRNENDAAIWLINDIIRNAEKIDEKIYTEEVKTKLFSWFKSLNTQSHWKPSEYEIQLLKEIASNIRNNIRPFCSEVSSLEGLTEKLQKLM